MQFIKFTQPNGRHAAPSAQPGGRLGVASFENELDWLFGTALSRLGDASRGRQFPVDLYEDKANTYVRAELPGVDRESINIEVVDGTLTIQASRKSKSGEGETTVSFSRQVSLPDETESDKVSAAYVNGVVTVTLPRKEEAKPRKINVSVN
jgi:HSP20 family protein